MDCHNPLWLRPAGFAKTWRSRLFPNDITVLRCFIIPPVKPFEQLTSKGQARRLRQMAQTALTHYPFKVKSLRLLSISFNCIFRVDTQDGQKFILRICLPGYRSLDEIRSESLWLAALSQDTDLLVPKPVLTKDGQLITTVEEVGVPEARHCMVFGWVNGIDLYHNMIPENFEKLGGFTARLHEHAAGWTPPADFSLPAHDDVLDDDWNNPNFWEQDNPELLPAKRTEIFSQTFAYTSAAFEEMYQNNGLPKVIHADLHQGNVRLYRGAMRALDFDDCLLGHWVQDIGITYYYLQRRENKQALMDAYQKGYESVRAWPADKKGQLEAVIAGRDLLLCQYIYFGSNPLYKNWLPSLLENAEIRLKKYLQEYA